MLNNSHSIELQARLYRGFNDPSRLAIVQSLRSGPFSVSEIVQATSLSQSNVSNHIAFLRERGLVGSEQYWRIVINHLGDDRDSELLQLGDSLLVDMTRCIYECTRNNFPYGAQPEDELMKTSLHGDQQ